MEKEEAIRVLNHMGGECTWTDEQAKALTMAITALEQREKPKEGMSAEDIFEVKTGRLPYDAEDDMGFLFWNDVKQMMHEYHNQFPSVKVVSDEEIENLCIEYFPNEKEWDSIPSFMLFAKWMRSRMSNNKTEL